MKVLALSDSLAPWHSFWIRIGQYLPTLPWPTEISQDPNAIAGLTAGDRLIVYRYSPQWGDLASKLRQARQRGVIVLSDLDDYLWQAGGWSRERLRGCTQALRECDVLTCSTEPLLTQLEVMFRQQRLLLIPNSAPRLPEQAQQVSPRPIRIGWTGAPWTRAADLALLRPLGEWVAARPDELRLVHVGHGEGRLSLADALGLRADQVEIHPLQGHGNYLQQINFHIGLAPLEQNSFNHYKSAIKVIEYSALGIPWLASDAEPYRALCHQWQWPGRLCQGPMAWILQLEQLMDKEIRQHEGEALKQLCLKHDSFTTGVARWAYALTSVLPIHRGD